MLDALLHNAMHAVRWLNEHLADPQLAGGPAAVAAANAAIAAAGQGCSSITQLVQQTRDAFEIGFLDLEGTLGGDSSLQESTPAPAASLPVSDVVAAAAGRLAAPLQAFGLAVAVAFPAACLCCNPGCGNLQGSSEVALLGPGSRCSGCKQARFCSKECLTAAWKAGHKAVCKRLKAAAAAAATG
jgi:hypothetical protein